ncbi:MAG TPA: amidohydrolase family protein [Candidatus Ratteibacteria bacterium]|uniref:Amidohydrolase n=1 Tax=candidate division TA06 bacterium ADurb.Bin131 TaxID=1852827 RepID=A0A1V6C4S8_UNCT6|nr:MAG: Amidohydrolase [candidate division TA06 bacterium ADurb.Bin131]HON04758.1 amidohydrolase family protein [bacterium]HPC28673.1 amidohydrolase family protein [bacterium]HRS05767.1 amidohydrolase family protein [Candidatus Ratteibacteria bacterium]HRV03436.1 amidohydrolase family protein [Candidatus Ratteibacteria bacterium]
MKIIDFHTHIFPDNLAGKALRSIESTGGIKPKFDGTLKGLINSMDNAGVSISVVLSIATKPKQFNSIFNWARSIYSERIIPFPSVHPDDEEVHQHILQIKSEGFKGLKMHPYFQGFYIDEERMFPIYETIAKAGLILVIHAGYDFAYERIEKAGPWRILRIMKEFPELHLVAAHLGGWQQWDIVEKLLIGKNLFIDTSFSQDFLEESQFMRMILRHHGMVLFGTDTPWTEQKDAVQKLKKIAIPEDIKSQIFYQNAAKLLNTGSTLDS